MPYITAGVRPDWVSYLTAFSGAGADLIEVGLPFSDPTVDGPTIQAASDAALARGVTAASVLAELSAIRVGIPLIASTYANIALRPGFAGALRAAGVTGLIVPDLPLDELAGLSAPGIEVSLLASPATPDDRLAEIGRRSQGKCMQLGWQKNPSHHQHREPANVEYPLHRPHCHLRRETQIRVPRNQIRTN